MVKGLLEISVANRRTVAAVPPNQFLVLSQTFFGKTLPASAASQSPPANALSTPSKKHRGLEASHLGTYRGIPANPDFHKPTSRSRLLLRSATDHVEPLRPKSIHAARDRNRILRETVFASAAAYQRLIPSHWHSVVVAKLLELGWCFVPGAKASTIGNLKTTPLPTATATTTET